MSMSKLELEAFEAWQFAYQRTDLVARLIAAALLDERDYNRAHGFDAELSEVISAQLDRFVQARDLEEQAHRALEAAKSAA